jgi:uncharacterized protein (TIGR03643 family)
MCSFCVELNFSKRIYYVCEQVLAKRVPVIVLMSIVPFEFQSRVKLTLPTKFQESVKELTIEQIDRVVEMAWEDRTPFEAILFQFGLAESDVIALMRRELKRSSFNRWRKRVNSGVSQKHLKKRQPEINRFKSAAQRTISMNKIAKRKIS